MGALVVSMPPAMVGAEIEIAPVGGSQGTTTATTTGTTTGMGTGMGTATGTGRTSRSWTDP